MPLSALDAVAALVVIDVQKGIMGMVPAASSEHVVGNSAKLAKAFRAKGLPVVLVNVTGGSPGRTDFVRPKYAFPGDFAELMPELEQSAGDVLVTKQRVGAFIGTGLDAELRARGVTQLFFTGVATTNGVEATARSAYDHGYNVVFVTDAITDRDMDAHDNAMAKVFPKIGELDTTENVLAMVGK